MIQEKKEKYAILFVCLGNICRSATAEAVMQFIVNRENLGSVISLDSAGTSALHQGEKADARMISHGAKRGYDLTSISRPVMPATDFKRFDLIIGMDSQNIKNLHLLAPDAESAQKIHIMTEYCTRHDANCVPDPYYGGADGFELVLDLLEDACEGLLANIHNKIINS